MSALPYGREALRQFREQQGRPSEQRQPSLLDEIPADAPRDNVTLTVWNGERWAAWKNWIATAPLARDEVPHSSAPAIPADARCVAATCGATHVWLIRDGERWLMYVGSKKAVNRRTDFASPHRDHAIRTAELWYGAPAAGWRAEAKR